MMQHLMAAAAEARRASSGERVVEIVITEDGLIVRGRGKSRGLIPISSTCDLDWSTFDHSPHLLLNSVRLVASDMDRQS